MRKLLFLILPFVSVWSFGQQSDATTKSNTDSQIRNAALGGVTRAIVSSMADALTDSKVNRSETLLTTGTNDYTITPGWTPDYSKFPQFKVKFVNGNTSTVTVNTIPVKKNVSTALSSGDIAAGAIYDIVYDGTNFQITLPGSGSGSGVSSVSSANADISVATGTTTPVLTLNSGSGANQIVKRDGSGNLNATTVTTIPTLSGDVSNSSNAITVIKINGTSLASLATGILKNTTTTGVPSIATGADLPVMTATIGGAVPTPPNDATKYLNGQGAFTTPSGSGTVNSGTAGQIAYYATSSSAVSGTTTGTGILTALGINIGSAGAPILFNGTGGTPSSIGLANGTGLPESGVTNLTADLAARALKNPSTRVITTSDTPTNADDGNWVEYNSASGATITIQPTSTGSWTVGATLNYRQQSTGAFTAAQGAGVTFINLSGSLVSLGAGATMVFVYKGSDVWYVFNGAKGVPTLTDGSVAFYSSTAGNLSQDNSNFFWDIGNKRLGLGLTTPASHIEIRDNTLSTTPSINSGITLSNTATSSLGVQKEPGQIYFNGKVWNTTSSTSQDVSVRLQMTPTQGNPVSANFLIGINPNGGGYTDYFLLNSSGFANAGQTVRIGTTALETNSIKRISSAQTTFESFSGIASGSALKLQYSSTFQQTSGDVGGMENFQSTVIASGTATPYNTRLDGTLNNAGTGAHTMLRIDPTITAQGGDMVAIDYNPTITSITGIHYGIRIRPAARNGWGVASPTALMHIAASTTSASSGQIKLAEGSGLTTPEDGNINYVNNNLEFTETSTVYKLAKTLTATATLDFGSTTAGNATDLTITVTGAADGDAVSIGVPNGSTLSDGAFTAWVSASNTVTIRFINNNLVTALDPASGTFRASVIKY